MEQMNKLHMKYFLLLVAIISYCSAGYGQVTAVQTGNRIDINLDVYDLMDTLQSLRHDITVFQIQSHCNQSLQYCGTNPVWS